jgi:predicted RNA-binding Zn ribbon-like protein
MAAAYVHVDGLAVPVQVSGHPGLELCNTLAGWNEPPIKDYLLSYDHLAVWAGQTGLLASADVAKLRALAGRRPRQAAAVLRHAHELRGRAYTVLLGRGQDAVFDRFADDVSAAAANFRLVRDDAVRREITSDAGLDAPIFAAAWVASELLISPAARQVRACPGSGCGWLFLDRTGRRRWCTMSTCGNRAKARRFTARHRSTTTADSTKASPDEMFVTPNNR